MQVTKGKERKNWQVSNVTRGSSVCKVAIHFLEVEQTIPLLH